MCENMREHCGETEEWVAEWLESLFRVNQNILFSLTTIAYHLRIRCLIGVCCAFLASKLREGQIQKSFESLEYHIAAEEWKHYIDDVDSILPNVYSNSLRLWYGFKEE